VVVRLVYAELPGPVAVCSPKQALCEPGDRPRVATAWLSTLEANDLARSHGRLSERGREEPSSVLPADLERVVVAEQRGVEPGARFFHGFVGVVGGEYDAAKLVLS
jgi:hypothetical protein